MFRLTASSIIDRSRNYLGELGIPVQALGLAGMANRIYCMYIYVDLSWE